jgi:GrpB-like predicted nucleotidyltransferase (UPF0157 family)
VSQQRYLIPGGPRAPQRSAPPSADRTLRGYDPRWPRIFDAERRRIRATLGARARGVEHVGSSSVPGLKGRQEIDVLVGVADAAEVDASTRLLANLGYVTQARSPRDSEPYSLLIRPGRIPFELLVVEHLGPLWTRHVWLRDYLRRDPARALEYARQKSRWAARYGSDTAGYKDAKRRFWAAVPDPAAER